MEVIEKTFNYSRPDSFHIYPFGDAHLGALYCLEDEIKETFYEVKHCKNAYIVGVGDYSECITQNDPRFEIRGLADWVEPDNIVESQRKRVVELFKPVANKIICLGTGNHEESIHRFHSNDITRNICADLGVPYSGYHAFINLSFNRSGGSTRAYVVHAWHGAGAAQTEGARLMRLMRLVNDIQADIYLMGHLHAMTSHTPDRLKLVNGKIKSSQLIATITGSWLLGYMQPHGDQKINPSYTERAGMKPNRIGCPIIHIEPDENKLTLES